MCSARVSTEGERVWAGCISKEYPIHSEGIAGSKYENYRQSRKYSSFAILYKFAMKKKMIHFNFRQKIEKKKDEKTIFISLLKCM